MAKKTTKAKAGGKKTKASGGTSFEAAVADLVASAQAMRIAMNALDLAALTEDERKHTVGKLRDGEATAMGGILDTVDAFPQVFAALADKDGGSDPAVAETAPARAALARVQTLQPLAILLDSLLGRVSDDVLASASTAKDVTIPAYAIGKANAASNPKVRETMATALDFYSKLSRRSAKTAKTGQAKKGTSATATS